MKQFIRKKCLYLLAQSWECRWGYTTVSHRRGQAPMRAEVRCVVASSHSLLPFVVEPTTLASPHPFPFGSHLQLCLSCNPNLLSWFHASRYRTTFHQNTFLINTRWIWSRLGEKVQLIWVGGGSILCSFRLGMYQDPAKPNQIKGFVSDSLSVSPESLGGCLVH